MNMNGNAIMTMNTHDMKCEAKSLNQRKTTRGVQTKAEMIEIRDEFLRGNGTSMRIE